MLSTPPRKAVDWWQLEAIRAAGLTNIAVVTGYRNHLLSSYKLVEFHNKNWFETNMVASLDMPKNGLKPNHV